MPVEKDKLKIISRGLETTCLMTLRTLVGILKDPTAISLFKLTISSSIS